VIAGGGGNGGPNLLKMVAHPCLFGGVVLLSEWQIPENESGRFNYLNEDELGINSRDVCWNPPRRGIDGASGFVGL
jgi:hypothetical protein